MKETIHRFKNVASSHIVASSAVIDTLGKNAHVAVISNAVVCSCKSQSATIKVIHGCSFAMQKEYHRLSEVFHHHYSLFLQYQRNEYSEMDIVKNRVYELYEELTRIRDNILNTSVEFVNGTQAGNRIIFELADGQILSTTTNETFSRHKFIIEKKGTGYDICVKNCLDSPELFEEYDFSKCS